MVNERSDLVVRKAGSEEIPALEPLWLALHRHYAELAPFLAGIPLRTPEDSWRRRRAMYERWLAEDAGFLIIGELEGRIVGYAALHLVDGLTAWQTSDRVGFWETMSVLPELAREGVGTAIGYAALDELRARGVTELMGRVIEGNKDARQFFTAHGGTPVNTAMLYRLSAVNPTPAGREAQ
jgi:GNAT superfamily N-acetyltransferase